MATDGVKIIDGDTAHDTYWGIMDLYDGGATKETIREGLPFPQPDYYDDFDYEIYTTAYALAMWEIGFITDEIVNEVKSVICKGACVKAWTADADAKTGKQRQKELDKLWNKITVANAKVRKRKKYMDRLHAGCQYVRTVDCPFQRPGKLHGRLPAGRICNRRIAGTRVRLSERPTRLQKLSDCFNFVTNRRNGRFYHSSQSYRRVAVHRGPGRNWN